MTLSAVSFLMINFVFGLCIGDALSYERIRTARRPVPRGIPIRPLDSSTMYRIARRPTEINPDSEPVFLPLHNIKRRPLQVMERISTDAKKTWNRPKKDNFNVLNFEAYVMKPTNMGAIVPVTERVLHDIAQAESNRDDLKPSPSSQRKYRTKKPKKNNVHSSRVKEYDDIEFYRAFLEHQKHAAMVKKLRPKPEPSSRLPIGIEFFENKKKQKVPFPPITYSPLYMNHLHRSQHHEAVEASNVQNIEMRYPDRTQHEIHVTEETQDIPTTTPFIPILSTTMNPMISLHPLNSNGPLNPMNQLDDSLSPMVEVEKLDVESIPTSQLVQMPIQPEAYQRFLIEPEMHRFTIDDVVMKHQSVAKHPFTGPVTLSPSLEYKNVPNTRMRPEPIAPASANNVYENQFNGRANFQTQLNYPAKTYVRGNYRRFGNARYKNVPIEASASSQQQSQQYSIDPVMMTTQMAITNDENDASTKNVAYDQTAKRMEKRNKKRRLIAFDILKINPDNPNNLEFSSSYTKRRTQGYASEEDHSTTPITPIKLKNATVEPNNEEMVTTVLPKDETVKYFQ